MNVLLFIDDETFYSRLYLERLETCYRVLYRTSYAAGTIALEKHPDNNLIILDIMMPTPEGHSAGETNQGQDTGLLFLSKHRDVLLARKIPVIILTNRSTKFVQQAVDRMTFPDGFVTVLAKSQTSNVVLQHAVEEVLDAT